MKETPIIFNTDNVRAILDGRKTQTRRTNGLDKINEHPLNYSFVGFKDNLGYPASEGFLWAGFKHYQSESPIYIKCPYGQVGDRLWLKETHKLTAYPTRFNIEYIKCEYLDGEVRRFEWADIPKKQQQLLKKITTWGKWRSGRFMYKFTHRHDLEITGVREERLQEISEADAQAEGFKPYTHHQVYGVIPQMDNRMVHRTAWGQFHKLWDSLNEKRGYSFFSNPWVWVIEFKKVAE